MKIETGNIFIHSYIDEDTQEEVITLSVLPNTIKSYRIAPDAQNKTELRDYALADCIRELWSNKNTDPFAVGDKEVSFDDIFNWATDGTKFSRS